LIAVDGAERMRSKMERLCRLDGKVSVREKKSSGEFVMGRRAMTTLVRFGHGWTYNCLELLLPPRGLATWKQFDLGTKTAVFTTKSLAFVFTSVALQ
jgi:hypothetical protein